MQRVMAWHLIEKQSLLEPANQAQAVRPIHSLICSVVYFCGVVWCGVVWCGVVWCGVVCMCCQLTFKSLLSPMTAVGMKDKDKK